MDPLFIVLGLAVPVLGFFFRPTRLIGRGGPWVLVGAGLLVVSMMLLFLSVKDIGQPVQAGSGSVAGEVQGLSEDNVRSLVKAIGG